MSLASNIAALATRVATEFNDVRTRDLVARSTSSYNMQTLGGSTTFTVPAGLGFAAGMAVRVSPVYAGTGDVSYHGEVTAYSGTTLTVDVTFTEGSPPDASAPGWVIYPADHGLHLPQGFTNPTLLAHGGDADPFWSPTDPAFDPRFVPTAGTTGHVLTKTSDGATFQASASAPADASETVKGIVELATSAEATTGADTGRAVTPAGVKVVADTKLRWRGYGADLTGQTVLVNDMVAFEDPVGSGLWATYVVKTQHVWSATPDYAKMDWLLGDIYAGETYPGIVELATTAESTTGTDTTRVVTPAGLKAHVDARTASATAAGIVELATTAEATTGTDAVRAVTPAGLAARTPAGSTTVSGLVELATDAEHAAGTNPSSNHASTVSGTKSMMIKGVPPVTLTDAATIATDASLGNVFRVTIAASRTLGTPTNPTDGQRARWEVTASGTGPWTLTLTTGAAGSFKFGTSPASLATIATGTTMFIEAFYRTASARWHVILASGGH